MSWKLALKDLWTIVKQAGSAYGDDKVPKMSGALAYYTAVSLAPLVVITIKVIAVFFGNTRASSQLKSQVTMLSGNDVANGLQSLLDNTSKPGHGDWATTISIIISLVGASFIFSELQDSLNTIWKVKPKAGRGIWGMIRDRLPSLTMVLAIAFMLLMSMFISTVVSQLSSGVIGATIGTSSGVAKVLFFLVDLIVSTAIIIVLFAAIFRYLPDVKISWKDVWLGAILTAVLFQIGKYALRVYLSKTSPGSAYGVAGSLVAMLIWVYYSAQIVYFGAELTRAYADNFGSRIVPSEIAEPLDARADATYTPTAKQTQQASSRRPSMKGQPKKSPLKTLHARYHRYTQRNTGGSPVSRSMSQHRSYVARYLPIFAGIVIGRFIWKRYHRAHAASATVKSRWQTAGNKWKDLATTLVGRHFAHS